MIPSVAKAESQSEVSKTEYGSASMMIVTDKNKLVTESFEDEQRKSKAEIMSISPALTTETVNPVSAIYRITNKISQILHCFLFILISLRSRDRA